VATAIFRLTGQIAYRLCRSKIPAGDWFKSHHVTSTNITVVRRRGHCWKMCPFVK